LLLELGVVLVMSPCNNWQILSVDWEYEPVKEEGSPTMLTNGNQKKIYKIQVVNIIKPP
jgi:hypothetical protein